MKKTGKRQIPCKYKNLTALSSRRKTTIHFVKVKPQLMFASSPRMKVH